MITKKQNIINDDHVNNNISKNINNFGNGGGNAVRMTSVTILGTRTAREDEDTLIACCYLTFALWFFSPMPFTLKLRDRKI